MKEFLVYTALRIGLFLAFLLIVGLVWVWIFGTGVSLFFWPVVISFVLSGVASYFWLNSPREALAQKVQSGTAGVSRRLEDRSAREDID